MTLPLVKSVNQHASKVALCLSGPVHERSALCPGDFVLSEAVLTIPVCTPYCRKLSWDVPEGARHADLIMQLCFLPFASRPTCAM